MELLSISISNLYVMGRERECIRDEERRDYKNSSYFDYFGELKW